MMAANLCGWQALLAIVALHSYSQQRRHCIITNCEQMLLQFQSQFRV